MKVQPVVGIATLLAVMTLLAGPVAARNVEIEFNASNFTPGAQIDNQYWPLIAGTTFVYAAEEDDGCVVEKLTVTGDTKSDFGGAYSNIVAWVIDERSWISESAMEITCWKRRPSTGTHRTMPATSGISARTHSPMATRRNVRTPAGHGRPVRMAQWLV